jgi:UDP-2,3-diacylglucosamine hydrolase
MLHPWIAYRIGNIWSKNSRLSHNEQYTFRGEDEPLYQFAREYAADNKVDYFIFGHYHTTADLTLPGGARLTLLKDWISSSPYICFDGSDLLTDGNV